MLVVKSYLFEIGPIMLKLKQTITKKVFRKHIIKRVKKNQFQRMKWKKETIPFDEESGEEKSGRTSHFLRLRWDGYALLKNYQPRLFHYFCYMGYPLGLSTFFAGEHAVIFLSKQHEKTKKTGDSFTLFYFFFNWIHLPSIACW